MTDKNEEISASESGRTPYIRGANARTGVKTAKNISLGDVVKSLSRQQREALISGYDLKGFAKIFEDESMMRTAEAFIASGMNVSQTARVTYMHRNTLTYRLNAIREKTGLDIRDFDMAVTFKLLYILYSAK